MICSAGRSGKLPGEYDVAEAQHAWDKRLWRRAKIAFATRDGRYIEHTVATLVGQRVFGIALGYEDLSYL